MAAGAALIVRIDELVALFNRQSLDLPDGLFDRHTQFVLNGTPFEAMLGRSATDPLVLMIARGPAGYRFAIKALQHALPDARAERVAAEDAAIDRGPALAFSLQLSGRLRGTDAPLDTVARVAVVIGGHGQVERAEVTVDPLVLEPLREARLRE